MGVLLRQALRTLCGVGNQWSYAVFWKIGCQNTKLLIWEECYYEVEPMKSVPLRISGIEKPELHFGEWEGSWVPEIQSSPFEIQAHNHLNLLIDKMMLNNRVNLVGAGIIGQAALTGSHKWILANNYNKDAHPAQVLKEVHLQFSAGMQTVAVIPVHPHGVVQLGSSMAIMENLAFVNDVKTLILQLGCVPGALLSEAYGVKESQEKPEIPNSIGGAVTVDPCKGYELMNSDQQYDFLLRQIQENNHVPGPTTHISTGTQTLNKRNGDFCEAQTASVMKSNPLFRDQLVNGTAGAEVIPSNSNFWLNNHASSFSSRCGLSYDPVSGQSSGTPSNLKLKEHHVLSDPGFREYNRNNMNSRNIKVGSQMRTREGQMFNYNDSVTTQLHEASKCGGGSQVGQTTFPGSFPDSLKATDSNVSSLPVVGNPPKNGDSSRAEWDLQSHSVGQMEIGNRLLGGSRKWHNHTDLKQMKDDLALKKETMGNDLFQALNFPLGHQKEHLPSIVTISGCSDNHTKRDAGSVNPRSNNATSVNGHNRPQSGDDLFDIVGVGFKNKLLNDTWNNVHLDGSHSETNTLMKEISSLVNMQEAGYDNYSVNEGMSDSGVYSLMGTDNLLDVVVSGVHSAGKQLADDTVSSKTTLTHIGSSSIHSVSPAIDVVNMSGKLQKEIFGIPKSHPKPAVLGSSSTSRSGFTKDDSGSHSQLSSIYGSQVSSWVEQGHNVNRDSSTSTAFSKRNDEIAKPSRKRLKPGENPRPRPKDRQMIQDRVKELREIVPNGAKCSIDALLERTIKHMLFLQSVTKHADKLKHSGDSKIISKEGGLLLKDNFEGGATWACEVGSQSMICPIIVEDLNPPRQLLVEMLCEERGFFLEIADFIRGLGLTILKGVMEARDDKIWARFAVEANRDVTRMEIFMSLVHHLEQTVKGGASSSANVLDINSMMVHHSFPQASSIPATGRASSIH